MSSPTAATAPPPSTPPPQPPLSINLQTPFLYQNRHTGQPSSAPLTVRQLCRILCPANGNTASTATATITPQSLLLGYDPSTHRYDPEGWRSASSVPIVKEACAMMWYYEVIIHGADNDGDGDGDGGLIATATTTTTTTKGPVTTRNLAQIIELDDAGVATRVFGVHPSATADVTVAATTNKDDRDSNTKINNNLEKTNNDITTTTTTTTNGGEWKCIRELPHLQMAMEALKELKSMPTYWPAAAAAANSFTASDTDDEYGNTTTNNDSNCNINGETTTTTKTAATTAAAAVSQETISEELEAFLSSTDHLATHTTASRNHDNDDNNDDDNDDNDEEYESDGGTKYVKDARTGNWIHEALAPPKKGTKIAGAGGEETFSASNAIFGTTTTTTNNINNNNNNKKRKRNKKAKFSAKNARNWIYVTGLPHDTNEQEVTIYFSKVGIIDLDPETQKPKVKLYRYKKGEQVQSSAESESASPVVGGAMMLKGDASICYARPESVELALQILDENLFREGVILSVQRAKFEQHGSSVDNDDNSNGGNAGNNVKHHGRRIVSEAKRKVARLAALQAVGWDEGENGRIAGGLKGLRIVVLMNMFDPKELEQQQRDGGKNDEKLHLLEKEVRAQCEEMGIVEKITIFSKHPAGVMIVKFTQPNAASEAVTAFNGKIRNDGRTVEASFWDGVTDYTMRDAEKEEKETEQRLDEFGDWLENQELPEEFKLRVDGEGE